MVIGSKYGKMGPKMKATGDETKHAAMENFGTFMKTFWRKNSWKTKSMATTSMFIKMEQSTKKIGRTHFNKGSEKKSGPTTENMKATTSKEKT